jgi:hypothetical protein
MKTDTTVGVSIGLILAGPYVHADWDFTAKAAQGHILFTIGFSYIFTIHTHGQG